MSSRRAALVCALLLLVGFASVAPAQERILNFHSVVRVRPDSTVEVQETIRVRAEGHLIQRGIFRDFPTTYTADNGRKVAVGFELLTAKRDGATEQRRIEHRANGVRVYLGNPDVYLQPGVYEYEIVYRTDRQLGFFADHDELYWNVTGSGWDFPIDAVSAEVELPPAIAPENVRLEGYTGVQGSKGQDYTARLRDGVPTFATTRKLYEHEGFTIVVMWPKGFVTPPSPGTQRARLLRDARPFVFAVVGLLALLFYYIGIWYLVGRDPKGRIVVPEYETPPGQSPASMRYLLNMKYDDRCFAAAILSLAVKGHLSIDREKSGLLGLKKSFVLERPKEPKLATLEDKVAAQSLHQKAPSEDERLLLKELLAPGMRLELRNENHSLVSAARSAHKKSLSQQFTPNFFRINDGWHLLGIVISILIGVFAIFLPAKNGSAGAEWFFGNPLGLITIALVAVGLLANGVFGRLLKAPTVAGRETMDHIRGFKLYLGVAEGAELRQMQGPPLSTALFETNFPAALALGVEQPWSERFAQVFAAQGPNYAPTWYQGDNWNSRDVSGFSSSFGSSFTGAISSAATAPGSSSGGGGGGSSGGGGGGGGGGGW